MSQESKPFPFERPPVLAAVPAPPALTVRKIENEEMPVLEQQVPQLAHFHPDRALMEQEVRRQHFLQQQMFQGAPMTQVQVTKKAMQLSRMLCPWGEDVYLLNSMLLLKEEVVAFMRLQWEHNNNIPPFPAFYSSSVYLLQLQTSQIGRRVIYLPFVANVIECTVGPVVIFRTGSQASSGLAQVHEECKAFEKPGRALTIINNAQKERLREDLPTFPGDFPYPSFKDIVCNYLRLHGAPQNPNIIIEARATFERLMGETFHYIRYYNQKYNRAPPPPQFFIHFCLLFSRLGFDQMGRNNESIVTQVVPRLRRNLPEVDEALFVNLQKALDVNLTVS
ncbi:unnamed protein product [Caenorhabditis sp. 36 PRJEB53466]|nr:unnamed protein product [Caenorhabditis sp. 36 PRJEB53466]